MVDFRKRLGKKDIKKKINPREIYDNLDLDTDKGPLRPNQEEILDDWYANYQNDKDVILKMHTGQGKTITGLLMLQSKLNQEIGPAMYICPNNYLVEQTCSQAESFGISFTRIEGEIPEDFLNENKILITSIQSLFNGLTKFNLGAKSEEVSSIVIDDAHACIDSIKDACSIILSRKNQCYHDILSMFGTELEEQGAGTYSDIKKGDYNSLLKVPYWAWYDNHTDIANILSKHNESKEIKFAWPILKDILKDCECYISGNTIEIVPYSLPLDIFGSFYKADHRIFMSATLSDDSFLIKGLGLSEETIQNPLCVDNALWSGEKMILIPSLIDSKLTRSEIVNHFGTPDSSRKSGILALVPSFNRTRDWERYESKIADKNSILEDISKLKQREFEKTLVIANRYDGIDLPDNSCRVLIIDSKPFFNSLVERYEEETRSSSDITKMKLAQKIEQALGRSVRGKKDYSAVVMIGTDLVKTVRSRRTKDYFSNQTKTQIDLGLELAELAKDEVEEDTDPIDVLKDLIDQLVNRDEGWKSYYQETMDQMENEEGTKNILQIFELEKEAENLYRSGNYIESSSKFKEIIDEYITSEEDKGWYLQEMARCLYPYSKTDSNNLQIQAHEHNRYLLKPLEGMKFEKITLSVERIENIKHWLAEFKNYEDMIVTISDSINKLKFGVSPDKFEQAFHDVMVALGFPSQRPDKEWKEGPDNLVQLSNDVSLLVECKNNVNTSREKIDKSETGQMNNASAWFRKNYGDVNVHRWLIIPTKYIDKAAGFNNQVEILRNKGLRKLVKNIDVFFKEFKDKDFSSLSDTVIQEAINNNSLKELDIINDYTEEPRHSQ